MWFSMLSMEKTEKSMAELQIELNKGFEFDKITEAGSKLESVHGRRLVGLKNMGNSCYLNSVLQVMKQVPAVCDRYFDKDEIFHTAPEDPVSDFSTQKNISEKTIYPHMHQNTHTQRKWRHCLNLDSLST